MDAVDFQGNGGDLERFARHGLKRATTFERPTRFDHVVRWDAGGMAGFGRIADLQSGIKLSASRMSWERPWSFRLHEAPSPLKIMLTRGAGPRLTAAGGGSFVLGHAGVQVLHATEAATRTCEFLQGGATFEQVALEIDPERLRDLLGAPALPRTLQALVTSTAPHALHEQPMSSAVSRLLDEILFADVARRTGSLFLEAKGLELLSAFIDELALEGEAQSALGEGDLERLERARRALREQVDSPPSLRELARAVGLNEYKLKFGFRTHFGTSVFGYLRAERMEQARRLLLQRSTTVTEVAMRVGYANPSKFAAAFRKHFGFPPSAVR